MPIKNLLERLQSEVSVFKPYDSLDNIEASVEWAWKYDMIQQAYTIAFELIISYMVEKLRDKNPFKGEKSKTNDPDKLYREFISSLLGIKDKDVQNGLFKGLLSLNQELTLELLNIEWIKQIRIPFQKLQENRNVINHAKGTKKGGELKADFSKPYHESLSILKGNLC